MQFGLLSNLLDPAILFFFFGLFAMLVKSNLEIPPAIAKFLSLYLLMAIGIKGGVAMSKSGFGPEVLYALSAALLMSALVPLYSYFILRQNKNVSAFDAAAIAATYGSVSAVTFIVASGFLGRQGIEPSGYMTAAMVVMESPAILMAVLLSTMIRLRDKRLAGSAAGGKNSSPFSIGKVLHEAFTDGVQLLLMASLLIGYLVGTEGALVMKPFISDIFKGMLAFFMLDMGLVVGRRLPEMRKAGVFLVGFGLIMPMLNATVAILLAKLFGLSVGDTFMLAVLAGSASYIVVPAVCRYTIPEANPSLYLTMALAVTFPFNLLVGLPLYFEMINYLGR